MVATKISKSANKSAKRTSKKSAASKMPFVIVRATSAGCHAGYLVSRKGDEVVLRDARRLWFWRGAGSLSELAVYGASKPSECRFGAKVVDQVVKGWCEIIACQPAGKAMIEAVPEWRA